MGSFTELIKQHSQEIKDIIGGSDIEQLQRTEEWHKQRLGRFTGSRMDELMKCNRSTAKMDWSRPEKIIGLGEAAIDYIFEKAMERKTGIVIQTPVTAAMRYGTENEQTVIQLLKDKYDIEIEEVGFVEFMEDIAGSSADGRVKEDGSAYENKCVTTWSQFRKRTKTVDESHMDFWQHQSEMLSLKTDKLLYSVAYPSESIFEPDIKDVHLQTVQASEVHQKAIKNRCLLGHMTCDYFLNGFDFDKALELACSNIKL